MPQAYPQLRVHTDHSLSLGASKMAKLLERAKEEKQPALALTNRAALYESVDFSESAAKYGIQPIIGLDIALDMPDIGRGGILLLAASETGYINLCRILMSTYDERILDKGKVGIPGERVVELSFLDAHNDGLILLTGGGQHRLTGLLPSLTKTVTKFEQAFTTLLAMFGDRMYVELCRNARTDIENEVERELVSAAFGAFGDVVCRDGISRSAAPLVATTDIWYAREENHISWEMIRALATKSTVVVEHGKVATDDDVRYHLRSNEAFEALFSDVPEALQNTFSVAQRCAFRPQKRAPILPPFETSGGRTEAEELRHQSIEGLELRLAAIADLSEAAADEYRKRLDYELGVIIQMGFPGYFLIVSDFIKWAKAHDIPVGPGRGSGAGSVVAWALTITNLDPIAYGLLFERFLNPERVSMPDFDIDFCQDRRDEVISYVQKRYGDDRVSMIVTYGGILSKTALRDAARIVTDPSAGHFAHREVAEFCKLLPEKESDRKKLLSTIYDEFDAVRTAISASPKMGALFEHAKRIEGLYRQSSTHAAGIIIGDRPLTELYPLTRDEESRMPVCALSQKWAESSGAVKFDFLGLKNLSVIKAAVRHIAAFEGIDVDIDTIDMADPAVYAAFSQGMTTGVFQMASAGMRQALRNIKPTRLGDITAINALYRPGPMQYIESYARRKAGTEHIDYPEPVHKTEPFLSETYGYMVYQEQVMQVAQVCAGYSLGAADLLRRAMGKKIAAEMAAQKDIFINGDAKTPGAVALGMSKETATKLFDDIEKFADYGFNKSHAAAYAVIAYQTMWLKVKHPAAFYSALLSYEKDAGTRARIRDEMLRESGILLLPPDINRSDYAFKPERVGARLMVRFGLSALNGVTTQLALLSERDRKPFADLHDFFERAGRLFNSAQLHTLSAAGCFDAFTPHRALAAGALSWLAQKSDKRKVANQTDMFGDHKFTFPADIMAISEWPDKIAKEFDAVGFYLGRHPIDGYATRLRKVGVKRRASYAAWMKQNNQANLENRGLCVMIRGCEIKTSRAGRTFLMVLVSEKDDDYTALVFQGKQRASGAETIEITSQTLAEMAAKFEAAAQKRDPVVLMANLTYDSSEFGLSVRIRSMQNASDVVADIQNDIIIQVARGMEVPVRTYIETKLASSRSDCPTDTVIQLQSKGSDPVTLPGHWHLKPGIMTTIEGLAGVLNIVDVQQDTSAHNVATDDGEDHSEDHATVEDERLAA